MGVVGAALIVVCCLHLAMLRRRLPGFRERLRTAGMLTLSRKSDEWFLNLGYLFFGCIAFWGVGIIVYPVPS
jgi:hypothetical protein